MLHIPEIQHPQGRLLLREGFRGAEGDFFQSLQGGPEISEIPLHHRRVRADQGRNLIHDLLQLLAQIRIALLPVLLQPVQFRPGGQPGKGGVQQRLRYLLPPGPGLFHVKQFHVRLPDLPVLFPVLRFGKHIKLAAQDPVRPGDAVLDKKGGGAEPGMLRIHLYGHIVAGTVQPVKGIRQGHHEGMHGIDDILGFLPVEAELPVLIIRILLLLQGGAGGAEGVAEKLLRPGRFAHGKQGVHFRRLEFLPDEMLTEGMDGADIHHIDFIQSVAQVFIRPAGPEPVPDLLLHFRGGGVGEGHHQEGFRIQPLLQHADDALDHDGGLSAAGGGAADNPAGRAPDGLQLLLRPFRHSGPPFLFHALLSSAGSLFSKMFHVKQFQVKSGSASTGRGVSVPRLVSSSRARPSGAETR